MTIRRYSLAHPQRVGVALSTAVFMLGFGGWAIFKQSDPDTPVWYHFLFWMAWSCFLLFFALRTLTSAREIIVLDNDQIEFVSALERERLMARDIQSIKVFVNEDVQIVVRHSSGKIYLAGPMNDFLHGILPAGYAAR